MEFVSAVLHKDTPALHEANLNYLTRNSQLSLNEPSRLGKVRQQTYWNQERYFPPQLDMGQIPITETKLEEQK